MADGGEHPPHLPLAAFRDGEFYLSLRVGVDFGGRGTLAAQENMMGGCGQTVFQADAAREYPQSVGGRHALDLRPVGLGDMVARVGHAV